MGQVTLQKSLSSSCPGATRSNLIRYSLCIFFYLLLPTTFTDALGTAVVVFVLVVLGSGGYIVGRQEAVSIARSHTIGSNSSFSVVPAQPEGALCSSAR